MADEKEHHEHHEHHSKSKNFFSNYWAVATIVLAILLVTVLIFNYSSGVSKSKAGQLVVDFANAQGANATLVSVTSEDSLYQVVVSIQGQEVPVYVTKDGKNLVPSLVPLTATTPENPDTNAPTTSDLPKSNKPVVELFVMSYCPYGTQAEKGILPVVNLLKDKIDFKLKFVSYVMHGQQEIDENTLQYCIQKEQSTKFNSYLSCFLEAGDSDSCLTSTGIDKTKLNACIAAADTQFKITENANSGAQYPKYNVDLSDNTKYGVQGSPTLIVNGIEASSARDAASLLNTICSAFNTAPAECSQTLSSAAPSPGFGYSAAGSNTDAQCG